MEVWWSQQVLTTYCAIVSWFSKSWFNFIFSGGVVASEEIQKQRKGCCWRSNNQVLLLRARRSFQIWWSKQSPWWILFGMGTIQHSGIVVHIYRRHITVQGCRGSARNTASWKKFVVGLTVALHEDSHDLKLDEGLNSSSLIQSPDISEGIVLTELEMMHQELEELLERLKCARASAVKLEFKITSVSWYTLVLSN